MQMKAYMVNYWKKVAAYFFWYLIDFESVLCINTKAYIWKSACGDQSWKRLYLKYYD